MTYLVFHPTHGWLTCKNTFSRRRVDAHEFDTKRHATAHSLRYLAVCYRVSGKRLRTLTDYTL